MLNLPVIIGPPDAYTPPDGTWNLSGNLAIAPSASQAATASPFALTAPSFSSGSHTASTEWNYANFDMSNTQGWAAGNITTQRFVRFQSPGINIAGAGGTVTTAVTVDIDDFPGWGGAATITSPVALRIGAKADNDRAVRSVAGSSPRWIDIAASTITYNSATTQITATVGFAGIAIGTSTLTNSVGAQTIDAAAALYIANSPQQGTNMTITQAHAIWVDAGTVRLDGALIVGGGEAGTPAANTLRGPNAAGTNVAGTTTTIAAGLGTGTGNAGTLAITGATGKAASGTTAHTASTILRFGNSQSVHPGTAGAVIDAPAVTWTDYNTAGSGTAAQAGAYAFAQPTFAATNTSVTTTDAATLYVANEPTVGTNMTLTNPWAIWVDAGHSRFDTTSTVASGDSATLNAFTMPASTITLSGSTNITTAAGFNLVNVGQPMYSAASALTITHSATVYIAAAPTGAGNGPATLTNAYALWVDAGSVRLDGTVIVGGGEGGTPAANTLRGANATGTDIAGAATTIAAGLGTGTGNAGTTVFTAALTKQATGTAAHSTSTILTIGNTQSAHPGTAGAVIDAPAVTWTDYNTAGSGTATQAVAYAIQTPTFAATNTSVTTTTATTVYIAAAPTAGPNQTFATASSTAGAFALWIDSGDVRLDGGIWFGANGTARTAANSTGIYQSAANTIAFQVNGSTEGTVVSAAWTLGRAGVAGTLSGANTTQSFTVRGPTTSGSSNSVAGNMFVASGRSSGTGNISTLNLQAVLAKNVSGTTGQSLTTVMTLGSSQAAHPGQAGAVIDHPAVTWEDYNTAGSGTATQAYAVAFQGPTFSALNSSVTTTTAATMLIGAAPTAGANMTITNYQGLVVGGALTIPSAAGVNYASIVVPAHTVTISGTTQMTSTVAVAGAAINQITVTDSSAVTIDAATGAYAAPPIVGGSVTITALSAVQAGLATTVASATGVNYNVIRIPAHTLTVTGTTAMTAAPAVSDAFFGQLTVTDASAVTITTAAGIYLAAAPTVGGSAVVTNTWGIFAGGATTIASAAAAQYAILNMPAHTVTLSGSTNVTATPGFAGIALGQITLSNASLTVSNAATLYIANAPTVTGGMPAITNVYALWVDAGAARFDGNVGFFSTAPAAQQTSGANLTNSVTSGGTDDTIANFTDLSVYANDAAAIRNDIYQLARKVKQVNDGLRTFGLFT